MGGALAPAVDLTEEIDAKIGAEIEALLHSLHAAGLQVGRQESVREHVNDFVPLETQKHLAHCSAPFVSNLMQIYRGQITFTLPI
jgi:hypothetical protein